MKEEFKIRTMGFGELAQMYNPSITAESASNMLRRWIIRNPKLNQELKSNGFRKHIKVLTPIMVLVFIKHLGPP